ncbi:MAG: DUF6776 family protein [Lysobacter sp.]
MNEASAELASTREQLNRWRAEAKELRQRHATLKRSDQISRAANLQVQQTLAERDQEIAALRVDAAFYERLGGATDKPRGLNVHSARFEPEAGGSWRYLIVLTQTLNRGVVSLGQLRFQVEGVRGGQLATVDWDELHQRPGAPAQSYSFRYFQQLNGSVMLPPGFTPQRVRVSLRNGTGSVDQILGWGKLISHAPAVSPASATRET